MSMPIHIDTLAYANQLAAAGITQHQAAAHARALGEALAKSIVVVPNDLALLRTDILARIDVLKVELNTRVDAVEQALNARLDAFEGRLKSMGWMVVASLAINVIVLIKLFSLHIQSHRLAPACGLANGSVSTWLPWQLPLKFRLVSATMNSGSDHGHAHPYQFA